MDDVTRYDQKMAWKLQENANDTGHCQEFRDQCTQAASDLRQQLATQNRER